MKPCYISLIAMLCLTLGQFWADAKPMNVINFGLEAGLTNPSVVAIATDCNDHVWIATESGLNCYDGTQIIPYRFFTDQNGQKQNLFGLNTLFFDSTDSILWVGTRLDGVVTIDCRTMRFAIHYPSDEIGGITNITSICKSRHGGVWLAQNHGRPMRVVMEQGNVELKERINPIAEPTFNRAILEDKHGNIYIGMRRHGMLNLNNSYSPYRQRWIPLV